MTLPFAIATVPLPDWLPWWVPALLLIPCLIYALLALLVPFGVFGLKGRLEVIEARLDEIQGEIRTLSLRLPAAIGEDLPASERANNERAIHDRATGERAPSRPPIPPVTRYPDHPEYEPERARLVPQAAPSASRAPRPDSRPQRAEPRFGPQ